MDYTLWSELVLFILMLGLSGFFSSSETALFSLSRVQLEQMRRDQHPRIDLIKRMLSQPRRLIMTILIGNELVNVTATVISAAVIIKLFGPEKKWINLFVMVPLLLLAGEITPKVLAIRHNMAFAGIESGPIDLFARLIKPLRMLIRNVADRFITLFVGKERSRGNIITEDMVRTLAHEAVGEGTLDSVEAQFIDQIFDFGNKTVEDVMTPRSYIFFLPVEMHLEGMIKELGRTRRTKVPIYREHRDNIVGILHARDLLGMDVKEVMQDPRGIEKVLREPYFVPESKLAADLFHDFRERKLSVALTVDEYGGVTGLVTMEDLLECIFGEIHSPSDELLQVNIKDLGGGRHAIDGAMPIREFNEEMHTELSDEWGETLGGLLLHLHGELPPKGTVIRVGELQFTVVEAEQNRIKTVELKRMSEAGSPGPESPESSEVESFEGRDRDRTGIGESFPAQGSMKTEEK
ncbi:MAG: hemolysin family protein [Pseudomonadota bacterium]